MVTPGHNRENVNAPMMMDRRLKLARVIAMLAPILNFVHATRLRHHAQSGRNGATGHGAVLHVAEELDNANDHACMVDDAMVKKSKFNNVFIHPVLYVQRGLHGRLIHHAR